MNRLARIAMAGGIAALLSLGAAAMPAAAHTSVSISIGAAPPPPRVEVVPPPRAGYVWVPGHWEWRGNHHVWIGGNWLRARPGYVYHAPEWRRAQGRWVYAAGRWDRDRDGIPNRYDRHPDNRRRG